MSTVELPSLERMAAKYLTMFTFSTCTSFMYISTVSNNHEFAVISPGPYISTFHLWFGLSVGKAFRLLLVPATRLMSSIKRTLDMDLALMEMQVLWSGRFHPMMLFKKMLNLIGGNLFP